MEGVSQCLLARRLGYLSENELTDLESDAEELARMLSGLRNSLTPSGEVRDTDPDSGYLTQGP